MSKEMVTANVADGHCVLTGSLKDGMHKRDYAGATITLPLAECRRLVKSGALVHPTKKITLYPGGCAKWRRGDMDFAAVAAALNISKIVVADTDA